MLTFTPSPERFIVEEIPAYSPSGEGDHTFLWVEKRGLTTFDAISAVALALGVSPRDVGYAGMKDRHATTRQWLSVPKADPEAAQAIRLPELSVLAAARHPPAPSGAAGERAVSGLRPPRRACERTHRGCLPDPARAS